MAAVVGQADAVHAFDRPDEAETAAQIDEPRGLGAPEGSEHLPGELEILALADAGLPPPAAEDALADLFRPVGVPDPLAQDVERALASRKRPLEQLAARRIVDGTITRQDGFGIVRAAYHDAIRQQRQAQAPPPPPPVQGTLL